MLDLKGQRFGTLLALERIPGTKIKPAKWLCICDCGKTVHVPTSQLRAGHKKSCGCRMLDNRKHAAKEYIQKDTINNTRVSALKSKLHKRNKSGIKGVRFNEQRNKWIAYIGFQGKQITLGYFNDKEEAIYARKIAEGKYHKPILEETRTESEI